MRAASASILFSLFAIVATDAAAGPSVSLNLHGRELEAQIIASQGGVCWLAESDGTYTAIRVRDVTTFRKLSRPVQPLSTIALRAQVRKEFGREYAVETAGRHIVVADRAIAGPCARRCEDVSRAFRTYFARRSVKLSESDYPLVTVIVRSQPEFQRRASGEGIAADSSLRGYYLRTSNRVLLFDPSSRVAIEPIRPQRSIVSLSSNGTPSSDASPSIANADLDGTLVHETVHQVAFNTGLHSRTGGNPQWVVEGLATMFEPDEVRRNVTSRDPVGRVNRDRMVWYMMRVRPDWRNGRLLEMVLSDDRFETDPLDAYAEAWSLTFFLAETRGTQYAAYLRALASRKTIHEPTEAERKAEFEKAFGRDFAGLEVRWLRFMSQVASKMTRR